MIDTIFRLETPEAIDLFFEKSINPTSEELIQKKMDAASTASAVVEHTTAPLPAASPEALTTTGAPHSVR